MNPNDVYRTFEGEIGSVDDLHAAIKWLSELSGGAHRFVWRGVSNASHGFHSSLYRRLWWTLAAEQGTTADQIDPPDESQLYVREQEILRRVKDWGLHAGTRGRLSALRQLAILQHHHAPTRLIDVSLNPFVSTWFAVEPKFDDLGRELIRSETDGRLFAIGTTGREISDEDELWEDSNESPWSMNNGVIQPSDWCSQTRVWLPTAMEPRIAAQSAAFLLGGVPDGSRQLPRSPQRNDVLTSQQARRLTSVYLRFHKVRPSGGGVSSSGSPAFTWRILGSAKASISNYLRSHLATSTHRVYPDFPGFGKFGNPDLAVRPPSPSDY